MNETDFFSNKKMAKFDSLGWGRAPQTVVGKSVLCDNSFEGLGWTIIIKIPFLPFLSKWRLIKLSQF